MAVDPRRTARLIKEAVETFELDLSGLVVLTEAATGSFAATAPLAAAAGADRVHAWSRDSSHGSADEAITETTAVARELGERERIEFATDRPVSVLSTTDLVTNLGFVRPVGDRLIDAAGPETVVSLMYEPWEFRGDVDVAACWASNVPVVGTDESDPRIATQGYVGILPVKLSLEQGIEVMGARYLVVGGGEMARHSVQKLSALGATVHQTDPETTDRLSDDIEPASLDAVAVVEHRSDRELVGSAGLVPVDRLAGVEPAEPPRVLHLCGRVEADALRAAGVPCTPEVPAEPGHMSYTAGALGPRPVVRLHAGGLAAGATAARHHGPDRPFQAAVDRAVGSSVGADFDARFKRAHGHPDHV